MPLNRDLLPLSVILLCTLPLIGCSGHGVGANVAPYQRPAPFEAAAMQARPALQGVDRQFRKQETSLAYEHNVSVELPTDALPARLAEVRSACESHQQWTCAVLDVSYGNDYTVPTGQIRMRLAPTAVEAAIQLAAKDGRITSRGTHGEDLAEPIADTERELSLLTTHRDRLSEFLNRKDLKVDEVINLSKEISSAQTQIDALNTQRANLKRRVDTEVLAINLAPPKGALETGQTPIKDAIGSFGVDFRGAVAQVIRFVAALLPWLVIIIPGLVLLRVLWRGITRWLGRREQSR